MLIKKYILGGLTVAMISLIYNYLAFSFLDIYPDLSIDIEFFKKFGLNFYVLIFLKNFLVGMILMVLFAHAYKNLDREKEGDRYLIKAIFYFSLYAIFALVSFSFADMLLLKSDNGLLLMFTIDGFVETLIATVPIRFFYVNPDAN